MFAVIAAALALAGAPATSQLTCDPAFVVGYSGPTGGGLTDPTTGRAWVSYDGCRAILAASLTPDEYAAVEQANNLSLGWYQGRGLLVILHESRHLAGELNECRTERYAYEHVGELIDRFVPAGERFLARQAAAMLHASVLANPVYREGC